MGPGNLQVPEHPSNSTQSPVPEHPSNSTQSAPLHLGDDFSSLGGAPERARGDHFLRRAGDGGIGYGYCLTDDKSEKTLAKPSSVKQYPIQGGGLGQSPGTLFCSPRGAPWASPGGLLGVPRGTPRALQMTSAGESRGPPPRPSPKERRGTLRLLNFRPANQVPRLI